jgi:hypothetical protein
MNETGDVVQRERNLQHQNSLKRITLIWWQWGILKLFAQNQMKGNLLIQCVMDEYEENNATIQARHPKLFKDDIYKFEASKKLVMCMPFDFIDGLKDEIDSYWQEMVEQVDEASEESSIKQHQTDQICKADWKTWYSW